MWPKFIYIKADFFERKLSGNERINKFLFFDLFVIMLESCIFVFFLINVYIILMLKIKLYTKDNENQYILKQINFEYF